MIANRRIGLAVFAMLAGTTLPATDVAARPAVSTASAVYIERLNSDASRTLEPAEQLSRGDRIVTVVNWYRFGGDGGFVITNPLPAAVAYQRSAWQREEVSVDGGHTWGRLGTLRYGRRFATPEDVTHVRWHIPATMRTRGQIAYSSIVR